MCFSTLNRLIMKRAASWLFGNTSKGLRPLVPADKDIDAAELLREWRKDKSSVVCALLDLPSISVRGRPVQTAGNLLKRAEGMSLSEGDSKWLRALQLIINDPSDPSGLQELAFSMAAKKQWNFLSRRFQVLPMCSVLSSLELGELEDLYVAVKQLGGSIVNSMDADQSEPPTVKRRRVQESSPSSSSTHAAAVIPPLFDSPIWLTGEALCSKLLECTLTEPSLTARLRDVLVELHDVHPGGECVSKLSKLVNSSREHLNLEEWAQKLQLSLLQKLVNECVSFAIQGDEKTSSAVSVLCLILGSRQEHLKDLNAAATSYRSAATITTDPRAKQALLKVLLELYNSPVQRPLVSGQELLALLAGESRWSTVVDLLAHLKPSIIDMASEWTSEQLLQLSDALERKDLPLSSTILVVIATRHEENKEYVEACRFYEKSFKMNGNNMDAENGLCRLAVIADCVQSAAATLLSAAPKTEDRIKAAMQLLVTHSQHVAEERVRHLESRLQRQLAGVLGARSENSHAAIVDEASQASDAATASQHFLPIEFSPVPTGQRLRLAHPNRVPLSCKPKQEWVRNLNPVVFGKMRYLVPDEMLVRDIKKLISKKIATTTQKQGLSLPSNLGSYTIAATLADEEVVGDIFQRSACADGVLTFEFGVKHSLLGLEVDVGLSRSV